MMNQTMAEWHGVMAQREEVLRAFIAKYGCHPDEVTQVVQNTMDGCVWHVEKRPLAGRANRFPCYEGGPLHNPGKHQRAGVEEVEPIKEFTYHEVHDCEGFANPTRKKLNEVIDRVNALAEAVWSKEVE